VPFFGGFVNVDTINGLFELVGGIICWLNVRKLLIDKSIKGVHWGVQAFFSVWGVWNLYYYPSLGQWCSFWGGVFLMTGNAIWTVLAIHYIRKERDYGRVL